MKDPRDKYISALQTLVSALIDTIDIERQINIDLDKKLQSCKESTKDG